MQGKTEDNRMRCRFPNLIAGRNMISHLLRESAWIRIAKPIKILIKKLPSTPGSVGVWVY